MREHTCVVSADKLGVLKVDFGQVEVLLEEKPAHLAGPQEDS